MLASLSRRRPCSSSADRGVGVVAAIRHHPEVLEAVGRQGPEGCCGQLDHQGLARSGGLRDASPGGQD